MVIISVMGDSRPKQPHHPSDLPLPELIGASDILTEELRKKVCILLFAFKCIDWSLTPIPILSLSLSPTHTVPHPHTPHVRYPGPTCEQLCKHLPARAEGYSWTLIYSSAKHGFSLKTLYREMTKFESPVLMVIEDTYGTVCVAMRWPSAANG
jgi:hypothetical protein